MKKELKGRGVYFNTYYIYDDNYVLKGILETHDRDVRKPYFVAWVNLQRFCGSYKGVTKVFYTEQEAIEEILK